MNLRDSRLDPAEVAMARSLLKTPLRQEPLWPALVAAAALALVALLFASVAVLAPPLTTRHVAVSAPG